MLNKPTFLRIFTDQNLGPQVNTEKEKSPRWTVEKIQPYYSRVDGRPKAQHLHHM